MSELHEDAMSVRIGPATLEAMAKAGVILLVARADLVHIIRPEDLDPDE